MVQDKGQVTDCCDECDEHLSSVKFGEIFDYLRKSKILKNRRRLLGVSWLVPVK